MYDVSLTRWHHKRPRHLQRASSTSRATHPVCWVCFTGDVSEAAELRTAWASAVGHDARTLAALDDVVGRHRESHRRYHGVRHVVWVVRHVQDLAAEVPVRDLGAVVAAAFFHDAVYRPGASDNEHQSAALAERVLADLGWAADRCREVGALVRATEGHESGGDPDRSVLLDADLAVLGSEPAAYQAYVTGVRAEYAGVDDTAWRRGRSEVVRDLLDREPLYATEPARRRWEARARANLTAELATLGQRFGD
jgi:predicted metal-dependent HD superfamily phosphohydrolase